MPIRLAIVAPCLSDGGEDDASAMRPIIFFSPPHTSRRDQLMMVGFGTAISGLAASFSQDGGRHAEVAMRTSNRLMCLCAAGDGVSTSRRLWIMAEVDVRVEESALQVLLARSWDLFELLHGRHTWNLAMEPTHNDDVEHGQRVDAARMLLQHFFERFAALLAANEEALWVNAVATPHTSINLMSAMMGLPCEVRGGVPTAAIDASLRWDDAEDMENLTATWAILRVADFRMLGGTLHASFVTMMRLYVWMMMTPIDGSSQTHCIPCFLADANVREMKEGEGDDEHLVEVPRWTCVVSLSMHMLVMVLQPTQTVGRIEAYKHLRRLAEHIANEYAARRISAASTKRTTEVWFGATRWRREDLRGTLMEAYAQPLRVMVLRLLHHRVLKHARQSLMLPAPGKKGWVGLHTDEDGGSSDGRRWTWMVSEHLSDQHV